MKRKDKCVTTEPSWLEMLPVEILMDEIVDRYYRVPDETETLIQQLRLRLCNKALCALINQTIVRRTTAYRATKNTPGWLLLQLNGLTSLDTRACYSDVLHDDIVRHLTGLRALSLGGCDNSVTDQSLSVLKNLEKLNLWWNSGITDAGLLCLAPHLRWLNLTQNTRISEQALEQMTALQELWLCVNTHISARCHLPLSLTALDLSSNQCLTNKTVVRLANNLRQLSLCRTRGITDRGISRLTGLTSLSLNNQSAVTDRSVRTLTRLCELHLTANREITDASLRKLTALHTLSLHSNEAQLFSTPFIMPALRDLSIITCVLDAYPDYHYLSQQTSLTHLDLCLNRDFVLDKDFFRPFVQLQKMYYITDDSEITRLVPILPPHCIVNEHPLAYYDTKKTEVR